VAKTPAPASNDAPVENVTGKGRATPSRAEQEAARKRPLVADTKEAKSRARSELAAARERARVGMANGEDKYLPVRDKGPQRRFVRDYVDGGFHLGEGVMPFMVIVIVATLIPVPEFQFWAFIALWIYVLFVIADMVFLSYRVKKLAREKFGESRVEKGLGWYGAMRTVQMRFMRLPKPQVKRGQRPA
jgi:hypothetical protein